MNHSTIALVLIALLAVNADIPKAWAADTGIKLPPRQMTWEADKVDIDLHSKIAVAYKPVIKQGEWTVIGDRARLDWVNQDNSDWQIGGSVQIRGAATEINADSGTLKVSEKTVRTIKLQGNPATFRQSSPTLPEAIHGYSNEMDFDLESRLVRFTGNANAAMGEYEVAASAITYDMDAQRLSTRPILPGQRTRITIPAPNRAQ